MRSVGNARAMEGTSVTINDSNEVVAAGFRTAASAVAGLVELTQGTACTPSANSVCEYAPASISTAYGVVKPSAVGATGVVKVAVSGAVATLSHAALVDGDLPSSMADKVITGSLAIPQGASPTTDAAGECAIDTTTGQLQCHDGTAERALPFIQERSFVIAAPATSDDINLMKAPWGMTIVGIDAIVQGTTSVTGQLQECSSTGASCTDLDSDIVADSDGAADDGSLTDSAIALGNWIRWKTTGVSGTPTFLTVTFRFRVVPD